MDIIYYATEFISKDVLKEAKKSRIQLKRATDENNYHDHQGAATDVPDGEGNTSVHAAVSANCKVTTPKIH